MIAVLFDISYEVIDHRGPKRRRRDVGEEGSKVGCLRIAGDASVILHKGRTISGGDVTILLLVFLSVGWAMKRRRHLCHLMCDECPVGRIDQSLRSVLVWGEPVSIIIADGV